MQQRNSKAPASCGQVPPPHLNITPCHVPNPALAAQNTTQVVCYSLPSAVNSELLSALLYLRSPWGGLAAQMQRFRFHCSEPASTLRVLKLFSKSKSSMGLNPPSLSANPALETVRGQREAGSLLIIYRIAANGCLFQSPLDHEMPLF